MGAIFIVPTLISESVPERMVPMISKLVERNIAVNYRNIFRNALLIHMKTGNWISDWFKSRFGSGNESIGLYNSTDDFIEESGKKIDIDNYSDMEKLYNKYNYPNVKSKKRSSREDDEPESTLNRGNASQRDISSTIRRNRDIENELDDIEKEKEKKLGKLRKEKDKREDKREDKDDEYKSLQKEKIKGEIKKLDKEAKKLESEAKKNSKDFHKNIEIKDIDRSQFTDLNKAQIPQGITFYTNITFEPTLVEFSVNDAIFTIGIKCIPYHFNDMDNIVSHILKYGKKGFISSVLRSVHSKWNWFKKKVIPFTKAQNIFHGRPIKVGTFIFLPKIWELSPNVDDPGITPIDDIIYSPDYYDLAKPKFIASRFGDASSATTWASTVVITIEDIEKSGLDMEYFYRSYKRLVKAGWGDVVIVDTSKEQITYCSMSMLSCSTMPFSYLKKLMDLDNVLDFTELSKFARGPFSKVPASTFMKGTKDE